MTPEVQPTRKELIEAAGRQFKENGKFICPDFVIDETKRELYGTLFLYAISSPLFSKEINGKSLDIEKGFLIHSPISGNGKTISMKVLNRFLIQEKDPRSFYIVSMAELANEWKLHEQENKVSGIRAFDRFERGNWLIDDLGCKEERFGLWRDEINLGERLIMHIYPKFETGGQKFHFTSNLQMDPENIEKTYDSRAATRLIKMVNDIYYDAPPMRSTAKAVGNLTPKNDSVYDLIILSDIENERVKNLFKETLDKFSTPKKLENISVVDHKGNWLSQIREYAPTLSEHERLAIISNLNVQLEVNGRSVDKESILEAIKILEYAE